MVWRLAKSLDKLSSEIKSAYKGTTIWTIGDEDHQNGWSDHNPNEAGVVCAADILADGGLNLFMFVDHLITKPHSNLRYVIFNRKIYERANNFEPESYNGSNPHTKHVHVSVGNGPDGRGTRDYDSTATWNIKAIGSVPGKPSKPSQGWTDKLMSDLPTLREGSIGLPVNRVQALLNIAGAGLVQDGKFGPRTENAVRRFQDRNDLAVDGIVGRYTWSKLVKG